MSNRPLSDRSLDQQILHLALGALGALLAEPLFVLADTAMVGHLGTHALAALSLASTIIFTVVGLCVFLAYATTANVARLLGADNQRHAFRVGIDGMWLGTGLGVALALILTLGAPALVTFLGAEGEVAQLAIDYLRTCVWGLPGMLLVLAATGVLRGMQDTRTVLIVTAVGSGANVLANWILIYGVNLGIAGSGLGTALCQTAMGVACGVVVAAKARSAQVSLLPHRSSVLANLRAGIPLFVRTLSLRAAIVITVVVASRMGDVTLAGHQIITSLWNLIAYGLDALAIAAQALVGRMLGASDITSVRTLVRRSLCWGIGFAVVCSVLLAVTSPWLIGVFTGDDAVHAAVNQALFTVCLLLPLAAVVFVLDGVLIGAGDGTYLAWAGMATLAAYLPALWLVFAIFQSSDPATAPGLVWLWVAFGGWFMAARASTVALRARGTHWMVVGAHH